MSKQNFEQFANTLVKKENLLKVLEELPIRLETRKQFIGHLNRKGILDSNNVNSLVLGTAFGEFCNSYFNHEIELDVADFIVMQDGLSDTNRLPTFNIGVANEN